MSILANLLHHIDSGGVQPWGVLAASRAPSFLPATILETHYALWIAGIAVGALLIVLARSRAKMVFLRGGQAVLVLTLVWMLLARGYDTPGERLHAVHQTIKGAVEKGDVDTIAATMDKSFIANDVGQRSITHETAKEALRALLKEVGPKDMMLTSYSHRFAQADAAVSNVTVTARTEYGPYLGTWQISWVDVAGEDWRMIRAESVPRTAP